MTPGGGFPKFFIYVIAGFCKQLTAYYACLRIGIALARATWHSSCNFFACSDF